EVLSIETYNEQKLENKKGHLIFGKEFELGVNVIDEQYSENGDLHVLCERESDGSHVVWTSFRTDDLETSYEDFYNGKYDLTREEGFKELDRRSGRGQEKLSGIYAFDESGKPSIVANNLEALLDASVSDGRVEVEGDPEYESINGKDYLKYTLEDEGVDVYFTKKEEYVRLKEEFEEVFGYEPSDASMEFNKYLEIASFPTNEISDI